MSGRLQQIELENFRGFANRQVLDLNADVVLIRGDNGSGKTSLTDGILWLLTGGLPHLTDRVKGFRQTHDAIGNRYCEGPSRVALTVLTDTGTWIFERSGNAKKSDLKAFLNNQPVRGEYALQEAFGSNDLDDFRSAVATWGVLRQDAIRSVLDSGGAALHERMASVVGLSEVNRFRAACRAAVTSLGQERKRVTAIQVASDSALALAQGALNALADRDFTQRNPLDWRLAETVAMVGGGLQIHASGINDLERLAEVGAEVATLTDLASAAADAHDAYVSQRAERNEGAAALEADLKATEAQSLNLERATSETQRLAESAMALLSDRCPVCDQAINLSTVRAKLQADLQNNQLRLVAAAEARNAISMLRQRLVDARSEEQHLAQAATLRDSRAGSFAKAASELTFVRLPDPQGPESLRMFARRFEQLRDALRNLYAKEKAEIEVDQVRLNAALAAAANQVTRVGELLRTIVEREQVMKALDKGAQVAADNIVARWLRELEPSFAEVFDRLAPHPTFGILQARQDIFYNKNQIVPEVVDSIRGISANPLLVYSEGQLNTVALSYFLGLALNAPNDILGFMVLDDPLQAMDVLAVLGFADLCRRLRGRRQLLITTHDRRYAELLGRKLMPREEAQVTITHNFSSWSPAGPNVETTRHDVNGQVEVPAGGQQKFQPSRESSAL